MSVGDHFYTTDAVERDSATPNSGYQYEGIAGYVFDTQTAGTVPFYRLFNPDTGDHFYTIDAVERDNAMTQNTYQDEGIAGYVFDTEAAGTVPFYRLLKGRSTHWILVR